ncbi:MAG: hypothetical protein RJA70_1792 [Pseudomonadota bacterium]
MFRQLRAVLLFATVLGSYAWQWTLWRTSGRRFFVQRWERTHRQNAARLAAGFTRLRGVFIKFGQVVSVLAPFLPQAYGEALEKLQDAVSPRTFGEMRARLVEAYGADPLRHFREFDEVPVAAASLAQVHRAVTASGQEVAVKLLYPNIESLIEADMRVLRWVMPVVHRVFGFRRSGSVIDQVDSMLRHETDYTHERSNLERMREIFKDRPQVIVPTVVPELCHKAVLVMSFESGVKLTDNDRLVREGIDRSAVAELIVDCYLQMLLEHRVFHADPHPGNLLARPGNQLVILDYGAVEDLSEPLVAGLKKVFMGGLSRNPQMVFQGIEAMGFVAEDGDRALLEAVSLEYLAVLRDVKITNFSSIDRGQLQKLSGFNQLKGRLRSVTGSLQYPEGYFYVERTVALLFGLIGQLAPERGLLGIAGPLASKAMMRGFAAQKAQPAPEAPNV